MVTHAIPQREVDCAVIIVTYNSARYIVGLLESLPAAANGLTYRVIIVDNGSVDGTADVVYGRPEVTFIETGANVGYAGGINIGRRHAGECSALAVLNPDLVLEPNALRVMFAALEDPNVGVAVPMLCEQDGILYQSLRREPTVASAIGDALFGSHFSRRPGWLSEMVRDSAEYRYRHTVDWATGAALLVSASCNRTVGAWDERFFLYSEEVDYAARVRAAGFRIDYVPEARARHRGGGSGQSPRLSVLMAVNRVRYIEKHRPGARAYRAAVFLHELLRSSDPVHRQALLAVTRRDSWPSVIASLKGQGADTRVAVSPGQA
jgi:GT2 family glycosyltransferase